MIRYGARIPAVDPILLSRDAAIATVTLNNRERLNALHKAMWQALRDAIRELGRDASVRCVVLRGAGDRAFAAGADIAEFARERNSVEQARKYGHATHDVLGVAALSDLDRLEAEHRDRIAEFNAKYQYTQDGKATERVVEAFFDNP